MIGRRSFTLALGTAAFLPGQTVLAANATRQIVIRAGRPDGPYHTLAVQFAEALSIAANGALTVDVQESPNSVQNVMDSVKLGPDTLFTAPPYLISQAHRGDKPFERNPKYDDIRSLTPIPGQTTHWLVRADSGIGDISGLARKPYISGAKGSLGERQTTALLKALGIDSSVQLIDLDVSGAPAAVKSGQVIGYATAGAFPIAAVTELASSLPLKILSLPESQIKQVMASDDSLTRMTIPRGTYPGIDEAINTVMLPAGIYTTRRMTDAVAYEITKYVWGQREALIKRNPAWGIFSPALLPMLGAKLHRGALRYYTEAKISVPAALK